MRKLKQQELLEKAEEKFLSGSYRDALREYAMILKEYPLLEEAKVGAYLSDLGMESEDEAQALFDYYHIIKEQNDNAIGIIDDLLNSINDAKAKVGKLLVQTKQDIFDHTDGVLYDEFLNIIKIKGSFKKAFEDIMFSTKVIIKSKEEFVDFAKRLIDAGYDDIALRYIDSTAHMFNYDKEIVDLYEYAQGKK